MKNVFAILTLLLPSAAAAHPYIDVEAQVEVVQSDGVPTTLRLTWTYDGDFSDTLLADFGLDTDGDGVLTEAEQAELETYVTQWPDGFNGDVYLVDPGDTDVERTFGDPAARSNHSARFVDGQLVEQFERPLPDQTQMVIGVYDPSYVSAYRIVNVTVSGDGGCAARLIRADRFRAQAKLAALIAQLPENTVELAYPPVGRDFADMVEVTCP